MPITTDNRPSGLSMAKLGLCRPQAATKKAFSHICGSELDGFPDVIKAPCRQTPKTLKPTLVAGPGLAIAHPWLLTIRQRQAQFFIPVITRLWSGLCRVFATALKALRLRPIMPPPPPPILLIHHLILRGIILCLAARLAAPKTLHQHLETLDRSQVAPDAQFKGHRTPYTNTKRPMKRRNS